MSESSISYTTAKLGDLKERPNNPRRHSRKQIDLLVETIKKTGYITPIVVDEENVILSGHGRKMALAKLGMTDVPVVKVVGLTEDKKVAYLLADNKLAELSRWDDKGLALQLDALIKIDFPPEILGFSEIEIHSALSLDRPSKKTDALDEKLPIRSEPAVSRAGDLWLLPSKDGNHRLLCADATKASSYDALMQGDLAQMVITDPPYNVPIAGNVTTKTAHREFAMASGELSEEEFEGFLTGVMHRMCDHSEERAVHYVFMSWHYLRQLLNAGSRSYEKMLNLCVWAKPHAGMGTTYRSQHELVAVYRHGTEPHINNFGLGGDGRWRSNLWQYPGGSPLHASQPDEMGLHPTVKPIRMILDAMRDCSHVAGIVLDPFCGSGTVLVAAHMARRRAYAMEIDPLYVDVAVRRWQNASKGAAVLATTGETFEQVAKSREGGVNG